MKNKDTLSKIQIEDQKIIENVELSIWEALIPVIILMMMLAYNIFFAEGELLGAYSNQFILLIAGALAAILGLFNKVNIRTMIVEILENLKSVFIPIMILFLVGALVAYYITTLQPLVSENSSPLFLFIAGALAICAMILPGISGSFILVLLGAYKPVLDAIHNRDFKLLAILASGAIIGLLTFSKVLKWLFNHYKNLTLAVLTGFILGSLNKIWPWKQTLTWRVNSHGIEVPFNEQSISPFSFNGDAQLSSAIILAILGFAVIILLEKVANMSSKN